MGLRDEVGHGDVEPLAGQPMLEVAQQAHGQLSLS
jgi:hypothetical protein